MYYIPKASPRLLDPVQQSMNVHFSLFQFSICMQVEATPVNLYYQLSIWLKTIILFLTLSKCQATTDKVYHYSIFLGFVLT